MTTENTPQRGDKAKFCPGKGFRQIGDAALKGDPQVTFRKEISSQVRNVSGVTWHEKRRTADAFYMITTPVIISTVAGICLGIKNRLQHVAEMRGNRKGSGAIRQPPPMSRRKLCTLCA